MLEILILAAVAAAGYADAPGWSALLGAAVVTSASWWRQVRLLARHALPAQPQVDSLPRGQHRHQFGLGARELSWGSAVALVAGQVSAGARSLRVPASLQLRQQPC